MKHTKFIQDSASAYMIAYNQAMQDTHNPNMAAQIASVVVIQAGNRAGAASADTSWHDAVHRTSWGECREGGR